MNSNRYIRTIYNEKDKPKTDYPLKLIEYLCRKFSIKPGMRLMEAGCGRGEFLLAFKKKGLNVYGLDRSTEIFDLINDVELKICDVEHDSIPYADSFFDIVYSKSFIEHLNNPERYFNEAKRVLKPGGMLITLVPDWETNYRIYFDDHTHKTPFTRVSLENLYLMAGFDDVIVTRFRQLPLNWQFPVLDILSSITSMFTPIRAKNKFLRWSKELMVMGVGYKN